MRGDFVNIVVSVSLGCAARDGTRILVAHALGTVLVDGRCRRRPIRFIVLREQAGRARVVTFEMPIRQRIIADLHTSPPHITPHMVCFKVHVSS